MKQITFKYILFIILFSSSQSLLFSTEQTKEKEIKDKIDSSAIFADEPESSKVSDSLLIEELRYKIKELELENIVFESEKELKGKQDSIKKAVQMARIDSLREVTEGSPIVLEGDTIIKLYNKRGGVTPSERAKNATKIILTSSKKITLKPNEVHILEDDYTTDIMLGDKVVMSLIDQDGLWNNKSRQELAEEYAKIIQDKVDYLHNEYGLKAKIKGVAIFIFIILAQIILIILTNRLFRYFKKRIRNYLSHKEFNQTSKIFQILDKTRTERLYLFLLRIAKYIMIALQLLITIPILFTIFPETKVHTISFISFIWGPTREILHNIIEFIPDLLKIIVIWLCFRYTIKFFKHIATEINKEKIKINGFYPDWAFPTYYIIRFLLYAFMLIMIWPLLPQSKSPIFQGVSVFIGVLISLGSTTVIGNLVAGIVMTYMRPFKVGDQIKFNDTVGTVMERTAFVTRVKNLKNEVITIPNSFIMSSQTVNFSTSADNFGLILHRVIGVGFEVPVPEAKRLLIEAAKETKGIVHLPEPFVNITEIKDTYIDYEINAYTHEDRKTSEIYGDLYANVLSKFSNAGYNLIAPHFVAMIDEDIESNTSKDIKKQINQKDDDTDTQTTTTTES